MAIPSCRASVERKAEISRDCASAQCKVSSERATSNHIDAGAFHFVEQSKAEKDNNYAYHHTDTDLPEVDGSLPHEGKAEGFDDKNHGIQGKQPSKVLRHRT